MSGSCATFALLGETYLVERGFQPPPEAVAAAARAFAGASPPDAWLWDDILIDFYPRQRRLRTVRASAPLDDARLHSQLRGPGRGAIGAGRLEALRRAGTVREDASPADALDWLLQHAPERVARLPGHYRFAGTAFERRYEADGGVAPGARARSIAVVMSYRDHSDVTIRCLEHLASQRTEAEVEVIVIDNRSADGEREAVDRALSTLFPARARHLLFDARFNLSYQNNVGVALTSADVVVMLNNDCFMLDPGCLQEIADWAMVPGVGTVAPRMLGRGGRLMTAGVNAGIDHGTGEQRLWECEFEPFSRLVRWTAANSTACAAISREAWHAVGGMDSCAFPSQYDDADLCLRMSAAGYRHLYVGTACVFHEPGTSEPRKREESTRLMQLLLARHGGVAGGAWPEFEVFRRGEFPVDSTAAAWKMFSDCFRKVVGWLKAHPDPESAGPGHPLVEAWRELDAMCAEPRPMPVDVRDADTMHAAEQSRLMLQAVQVCRRFAAFNEVKPSLEPALAAIESQLRNFLAAATNGAERQ